MRTLFDLHGAEPETAEPGAGESVRGKPVGGKPVREKPVREKDAAELNGICRSVLESLSADFRHREIRAVFYPYIGLTHTIRRRGTAWVVRISDHCRQAPREVLEAIVTILAGKLLRRRVPQRMGQIYDQWRQESRVAAAVNLRRTEKGRKQFATHAGHWHSLPEIYKSVNRQFFNDQIEIQKIGWGVRRSWGRLGHYDPSHHTITLSPVLDSPEVPPFVVNFIVYHEMLHTVFTDTASYGHRRHHPAAFRQAERAHPDFAATRKFITEFCARRRR